MILAVAYVVAILEDDGKRLAAMQTCLAEILPAAEVVCFDHAQTMIGWLTDHLGQVVLISLDHDLPLRGQARDAIDCGTGREVAEYLAAMPPTCPVIVHSSNDTCAAGMFFALKDSGWPCGRVYPSNDTAWIAASWADRVRTYVSDGWIGAAKPRQDNGI